MWWWTDLFRLFLLPFSYLSYEGNSSDSCAWWENKMRSCTSMQCKASSASVIHIRLLLLFWCRRQAAGLQKKHTLEVRKADLSLGLLSSHLWASCFLIHKVEMISRLRTAWGFRELQHGTSVCELLYDTQCNLIWLSSNWPKPLEMLDRASDRRWQSG